MGSTEIDERLASLYRRMRALTPPEFKALARAGQRRRGPIESITSIVGLDGRYRLQRGDPMERARADARAAFKRQRRQPPNLKRGLQRPLLFVAAAWLVVSMGTVSALMVLLEPLWPIIEKRQLVAGAMIACFSLGAAALAAAAIAELLRRRSLRDLASPLGPIILRDLRATGLGLATYLCIVLAIVLLVGGTAEWANVTPGGVRLGVVAVSVTLLVLTVFAVVRWWQVRAFSPGAVRPLRDVELAVATETIDPSVDTTLLRVAWESVVGPPREGSQRMPSEVPS